ncbi:hypothetical protein [Streptomyces sp. MJM8645]|uniref:hypothetical protein n=1 Tax=Streptomycetaceae TaxID=2062 RepID=UPI0007AFC30E|nr:hypothetical protein [Streptomyces sp. MJM8645]
MSALTEPVPGDRAALLVARTGIPVLLLAGETGVPTLAASVGTADPRRYTATTALYGDGMRGEVHAPGGPDPEQLVHQALPGAAPVRFALLATPGGMTLGVEARHDGLVARAGVWQGWTLLHITLDQYDRGRLPALRLIGADSLPRGRPGRPSCPESARRLRQVSR